MAATKQPTNQTVKPVYALLGEDSYLQVREINRIAAMMPADTQRLDLDGERAQLADVLDELRSFAMFGGGKLVAVRNADDFISRFRDQLEDYLASPSDSATLVLRVKTLAKNTRIYKSIGKAGEVLECAPPSERALPGWIIAHAKQAHHLTIANDAAALLTDLIGADLGRLDNELAKLAVMCGGKGPIGVNEIGGCVAFQREQEIKDMTLELALGKPASALKRWRQLMQLDPSAEFRAITWLSMWLEDVGVVVTGGNTGKMAWKYRDALPVFLRVAKSLGPKRHASAVAMLADMDLRTKSGLGDAAGNVERFILSFAN